MSVKETIRALPVTPSELARRLKVSDGTVHDWRSGRRTPTVETAAQIEIATGVYGIVAEVVKERIAAKERPTAEAAAAADASQPSAAA